MQTIVAISGCEVKGWEGLRGTTGCGDGGGSGTASYKQVPTWHCMPIAPMYEPSCRGGAINDALAMMHARVWSHLIRLLQALQSCRSDPPCFGMAS